VYRYLISTFLFLYKLHVNLLVTLSSIKHCHLPLPNHNLAMSTSTLLTNFLSYIRPSNKFIHPTTQTSILNLKTAAANPLSSLKVMSATTSISPHVHAGRAAMEAEAGQENGTCATAPDSSGWEREIMDDVSASFNISLISDTSTSISTPSSSTDDLSLSPPPQLLLPSICAFPSFSPFQHPASEPLYDILSRPFFMQEPKVYPYAYSTGGGLGLGISVPSEKWDSDGGGEVMVPLSGLGSGLYSLEEVEEEEG
jgi:hypothetical protein